jgi:pyrroline-5-carboxylate reductase
MKIGFFGCGNMGSALAVGMKNHDPSIEQYFFTPTKDKARYLAENLKGHFVNFQEEMPKDLDWYVLAFKPQSLNDFHFSFNQNSKIISVLAGTSIDKLVKKFNVNQIARLMPNTPSSIGFGANLFYSSFPCDEIISVIESLGKVFLMSSEKELDNITAFSGSGPAIIFEFARLFEKHLISINGPTPFARELIAQTFLGSAKLMEVASLDDRSFESLRNQVTSKKGVTFEALEILEKNGLDNIMGGAFMAAYKRTLELKKGI